MLFVLSPICLFVCLFVFAGCCDVLRSLFSRLHLLFSRRLLVKYLLFRCLLVSVVRRSSFVLLAFTFVPVFFFFKLTVRTFTLFLDSWAFAFLIFFVICFLGVAFWAFSS